MEIVSICYRDQEVLQFAVCKPENKEHRWYVSVQAQRLEDQGSQWCKPLSESESLEAEH